MGRVVEVEIIKLPNQLLRATSIDVNFETSNEWLDVISKVDKGWRITGKTQGISAPQVGILRRVILCRIKKKPIIMMNPAILFKFGKCKSNEGCESVDWRYIVKRPLFGVVEYWDENCKRKRIFCSKRWIRVVCHEIDHLDGICIDESGVRTT